MIASTAMCSIFTCLFGLISLSGDRPNILQPHTPFWGSVNKLCSIFKSTEIVLLSVPGSWIKRNQVGEVEVGLKGVTRELVSLHNLNHLPAVIEDQDIYEDDYVANLCYRPHDGDPCIATKSLKVFVGTWNVAGRSPVGCLELDLGEWLNIKEGADIYVLGFQEIVPLTARAVIGIEDPREARNWNLLIRQTLNDKNDSALGVPGCKQRISTTSEMPTPLTGQGNKNKLDPKQSGRYMLVASKKMVGVFISVWMKQTVVKRYRISVKFSSVACGIMGYLGNKGSIAVSISIEETSFCFVAAHLASGEKKGDKGRRNYQVSEILRRTAFTRLNHDVHGHHPLTILGHDRIFWFGDLNYRLYSKDNIARQLIGKQDWGALQEFDQLQKELEDGGVFEGWKEGSIRFAPTYKYCSSNSGHYSDGTANARGERQRTPAWCDRILWYGKGVKQLSYFRSESKFSDHRPVSAIFSTYIEVLKSTNPRLIFVPSKVPAICPYNNGEMHVDEEEFGSK